MAIYFCSHRTVSSAMHSTGYTQEMAEQGTGFFCEWCAVRHCSKCKTHNLKWKRSQAKPGMAASSFSCWTGHRCNGHAAGGFQGWGAMEVSARKRKAAHCRTCVAKLKSGLKMQLPSVPQKVAATDAAPSSVAVLDAWRSLRYVASGQAAVEHYKRSGLRHVKNRT